jgi:hypothetical protein
LFSANFKMVICLPSGSVGAFLPYETQAQPFHV